MHGERMHGERVDQAKIHDEQQADGKSTIIMAALGPHRHLTLAGWYHVRIRSPFPFELCRVSRVLPKLIFDAQNEVTSREVLGFYMYVPS